MNAINFIRNDLINFTFVPFQFQLFLHYFLLNFTDVGYEFFFKEVSMILN